ncbi:MAG TPA: hypothetical protein VNF51_00515 [Candidatus Paceibacterota bacterium]|nr:hypothetical protein [Candidatus Paceibacterota bacterium]
MCIKQVVRWYLYAINNDPATNEYLAKIIGEQNQECEHREKLCIDKKRRDLWECPRGYADVRRAIAAIPQFNLKIEVFKEKSNDIITRYDLWKRSVQKKSLHATLKRGMSRGMN